MGSVIKGYRYRLIDNRSFELPLPIKYELLKEDDPVALYEVSADEKVSVSILTKYKENMITPIYRSLDIADIYYFFSSRVFQNGTPFTAAELQMLGLEKYSVYDIIRKTRGVTPYDTYWLRFDGDKCDYETARDNWIELTSNTRPAEQPAAESSAAQQLPAQFAAPPGTVAFTATSTKTLDDEEESHVNDILGQHKMNFDEMLADVEEIKSKPVENNTMSMDEIDALLLKSGLGAEISAPEPAPTEEKTESSGGKMSQEDIEKMLAAASAPEPAPAPAEEKPAASGGKMSQEDIEKMLAAASAPEPAPAPTEEKPASGGKMSQEDIEKMLAAASAPEPAPAPAEEKPAASGGKMSQEDIEKMLAAASAPEPAPAPVEEKPAASGGKMSQEDIEKMLAAASAPEPEPAPAEEKPAASGGKMSQEDIEKMLAAASAPEPAPAPVEEKPASGGKMSQADIEALLNGMKEDAGQ